ncbi:MAG: hypothetical protein KBG84_07295 [Planctomycetes bacterium]|nr:hypothetical protein [Planctomycetota bacterium]
MGKPLQQSTLLGREMMSRIETAVAQAEARTSCEFVIVLAPASSRYEGAAMRTGALAAVLTFVAVYWFMRIAMNLRPDALYLLGEAVAMGALVAFAFARFAPLRRLLARRVTQSLFVSQAASAAFHEQKVAWTKDHNAALLYVSVQEGEARILGDLGLQQKAGEATLNEIQASLNSANEGEGAALLEQALGRLGELGAKHFPRAVGDVNELPDKPVIRLP